MAIHIHIHRKAAKDAGRKATYSHEAGNKFAPAIEEGGRIVWTGTQRYGTQGEAVAEAQRQLNKAGAKDAEIREMTEAQVLAKIRAGEWEAMSDVKRGKHVEIRTSTGKRVTIKVKDSAPCGCKGKK